MEETLYKTKINYADIMLSTNMSEGISKILSKYVNDRYSYDEFHIEHSEFVTTFTFIRLYDFPIVLEIKNVINNIKTFDDGNVTFNFSNQKELINGINSFQ